MPDQDFFQRQMSEFSAHHARAVEMAGRDEQAERHISTAEYELTQTHRALTAVLQEMHDHAPVPAADTVPVSAAPTPEVEVVVPADDAVAA